MTPASLDELVAALAAATPQTRLLAGGTDLVRAIRAARRASPTCSSTSPGSPSSPPSAWTARRCASARSCTFTQLQWDPLVREHALCLSLAAAQVGSAQIRNAGTIGGNIANASPCADGATALTALGAEVTTVDGAGATRTRPIGEVLLGPNRTSLAHDEAITEFAFPALGPEHRSAFAKIGSRTAVSVARLSAALVVRFDAAVGHARRRARRAGRGRARSPSAPPRLEQALEGRPADEETARLFAEGCVAAVQESIPGRYSLPYKQHAAVGLAYDAWNMLALSAPCEPAWA